MTDYPALDVHVDRTYSCPECGFSTDEPDDFSRGQYQGGSGGLRTVICPSCATELEGWP